mmetsp:Transcript_1183/g.4925  ORF Transcript_1183/g.4925 Transcript_1183/m.4925 type:complete len:242 (-) Transcript_1183:544-1269(-)
MPNASISCPCWRSEYNTSSWMSFDAVMDTALKLSAIFVPSKRSMLRKNARERLLRYDKSPLSSRIPTAAYPSSRSANATAQKFGKPLCKTLYVSTRAKNAFGNARAYDVKAASSLVFVSLHRKSTSMSSRIASKLFIFSNTSAGKSSHTEPSAATSMGFFTQPHPACDCTYECACVPLIGIPNCRPASTLLVASKPPRYAYRLALTPPSTPCARRNPNSSSIAFCPATSRCLAAFVANKLA